jgi:hypothetical protein
MVNKKEKQHKALKNTIKCKESKCQLLILKKLKSMTTAEKLNGQSSYKTKKDS